MDSITQYLTHLLAGADPSQPGQVGLFQILGAFLVAYFGGILSSLTPCVYPMIPITVGVIGGTADSARTANPSRAWRDVFIRSVAYLGGVTVVFAFLGVLAGLTGKVFGSMTNTSGWYITLGVVMTVSGLLMMEVIPFDPMAWWEQIKRKLRRSRGQPHPAHSPTHHREMTLLGAFSLGASSGLIASPCTTPVLTVILAFIAKTQSIGMGLGLMFSFSLGLGTLLLVIAAFTGAFQILPRSGSWMKAVKIGSGILLLGFAEYLVFRAGQLGGS